MIFVENIAFLDKCRVKWGIRQGWSVARIAVALGLSMEAVSTVASEEFIGPELPINRT